VQQRLALTARDERQLWLGVPLGVPDPSSLVTTVKAILATKIGQAGAHLLLINRPAIPWQRRRALLRSQKISGRTL